MYPGYLRAVKKIIAKEYEKELRACTKKYGVSIGQLDEQLDQQLDGLLDENLAELDQLLDDSKDELDELLEEGQSELESVFNNNLLEQEEVLTQALNIDLDSVELR